MKPPLLQPHNLSTPTLLSPSLSLHFSLPPRTNNPNNPKLSLKPPLSPSLISSNLKLKSTRHLPALCSSNSSIESSNPIASVDSSSAADAPSLEHNDSGNQWLSEIRNPNFPPFMSLWSRKFKLSLGDQAFFLLTFISCATSVALVGFVAAAVPTLRAMERVANSLARLADTAQEELPSTMAAIRLSGMEISDLTLELSDLSHEITVGVNKSAQSIQAAEVGIRQIGAIARQQTASMIQERASLPNISLQPVVSGAAKKTSRAVGYATRTFINMISRGDLMSNNKGDDSDDRSMAVVEDTQLFPRTPNQFPHRICTTSQRWSICMQLSPLA